MFRQKLTALLLLINLTSLGQEINKEEADSLVAVLGKTKASPERVDLLLMLAEYHIHKPGENKIDFDSAQKFINESAKLNRSQRSVTGEGYKLLVESYLTLEKGSRDTSKKFAEQAVAVLERSDNKFYLGKAYFHLSGFYDHQVLDQIQPKISFVEKALNAYDQAGNIERKSDCLKMLGDLYHINGEIEKAIEATRQALAGYESINYKDLQSVYALMGEMYRAYENYGMAIHYELKALNTAHRLNDTTMQLCQINMTLGSIYRDLERYDLAVKYHKDALLIAEKYQDRYSVLLLMLNIINATIPVDGASAEQPLQAIEFLKSMPKTYVTPADELEEYLIALAYCKVYVAAKQFANAKPYCNTLIKLSDSPTLHDDAKNNINRVITTYFLGTHQYQMGRVFLARNKISSALLPGSLRYALDCKLWYKLDSAQGNFHSAFNYYYTYKTITDSLFNVTKTRQLQHIEVEFETAKKEDSIKLKDRDITLLKQTNSLQEANLAKARFIRNATIGGIILTLGIIGLLYRQYRHKQQSNKLITDKNEQLQHLLTEKEWLLKEIHHRVKNNLQIVMSLLNSQSAYIDNESALSAIQDSQHRVHAMSLIHQKLYGSDNVAAIDMSVYIRELATYLEESFVTRKRIRFEFSIEPLEMDVSHAVPLGLILNEAITNSMKYAFPSDREGLISISLSKPAPYHYKLTVSDNGIGMPTEYIDKKSGSLGLSLMKGLTEDLDGIFTIENKNGTTISVSFIYDLGVKRPGQISSALVLNN